MIIEGSGSRGGGKTVAQLRKLFLYARHAELIEDAQRFDWNWFREHQNEGELKTGERVVLMVVTNEMDLRRKIVGQQFDAILPESWLRKFPWLRLFEGRV